MSPHVDILDQSEHLAPSFFGSLAFHGLLVAGFQVNMVTQPEDSSSKGRR